MNFSMEKTTPADFQILFTNPLDKNKVKELTILISNSKALFDALVNTILHDGVPASSRAAQVMGYVGIIREEWFLVHLSTILNSLVVEENETICRNIVRVLWKIKLPREVQGLVADKCLKWLENKNRSIAVKAFCLHTLSKIVEHEPELGGEIRAIAESLLPYASSGLKNSAEKILVKINKFGY